MLPPNKANGRRKKKNKNKNKRIIIIQVSARKCNRFTD